MNQNPEQLANANDWLKINPADDIPANFNRIADQLFNQWLIQVNNNYYRLLEIEFYYDNKANHQDPYIYGRPPQNTLGDWFFHAVGIDITFGEGSTFGGILIRSIEKLDADSAPAQGECTFGPWNTQQEILKGFNTNIHNGSVNFNLVSVSETNFSVTKEKTFQSQRIGIKQKDTDTDGYHLKPFRYLIRPELKHREKTKIALVLYEQSAKDKEALDEIQKILGSEFLKQYR